MSGMRTSPRGDVGAQRRRSWSTEQKKAIVAEIDVGGATLYYSGLVNSIQAMRLART